MFISPRETVPRFISMNLPIESQQKSIDKLKSMVERAAGINLSQLLIFKLCLVCWLLKLHFYVQLMKRKFHLHSRDLHHKLWENSES